LADQLSDGETILSDGELDAAELSLSTAELLRRGGPWGQGFPEPLFDNRFEVVEQRIVGGSHLKLVLRPAGSLQEIDAIAFNHPDTLNTESSVHVRAAYRLDINTFRNRRTPQLVVEHIQSD
jgi:single-stranded-DNA-specific exonuclease